MSRNLFRISLVLCFAFAAIRSHAQQTPGPSVSLPVLGFVLDPAGALRPLVGVTGSASIGAPVNLGFGIAQAVTPPNRDYVLAMTADANWPLLLQTSGNTITAVGTDLFFGPEAQTADCYQPALVDDGPRAKCRRSASGTNGTSHIDAIALSPTGSSAGFYSASTGRIYAVGNLPQSPALSGTFDVASFGTISAFGISDDAQTMVFGVSSGDTGSLFLIASGQPPRLIGPIHHASAIQFLRNSNGAVIADDLDNTIYTLSGGQIYAIAGPGDGISTPVGIAVSNDNQKVFVGNSGSASVTTIGLNGTGTQSVSCDCTLTGLRPTSADSVFQLTDFSGGPILLFDGNSTTPRTIFVPVRAQF